MRSLFLSLAGTLVISSTTVFGQANPVITTDLLPDGVVGDQVSQLTIQVDSATPLPAPGAISFDAVPGFLIQPSTATVPSGLTTFKQTFTLARDPKRCLQNGERRINVHLASREPARPYHAQTHRTFRYRNEIQVWCFLMLAILGVVLGYVIRFFINVLKSIPPPPAQPEGDTEGPITKWVRAHYYQVDLAVTMAIALLVLLAVIKDGRPPEAGSTWYGAMGMGAALGLLTNSELLTKVR